VLEERWREGEKKERIGTYYMQTLVFVHKYFVLFFIGI
jgi:hypothetical protein